MELGDVCQGLADVTLSWYSPGSQDAGSEVGCVGIGWRGAPWGGLPRAVGSSPQSGPPQKTLGLGGPRVQGRDCVLWGQLGQKASRSWLRP